MKVFREQWEKVVRFHGHACPGLAQGLRVAQAALDNLGISGPAEDEELVAIVEHDSCGTDAVQVLTGCTFGKGNLVFRDYGKQVLTLLRRENGEGVRVYSDLNCIPVPVGYVELRQLLRDNRATIEDQQRFRNLQEERIKQILCIAQEKILRIQTVNTALPPKAHLFSSIMCSCCGERVASCRGFKVDEQFFCQPCARENYRSILARQLDGDDSGDVSQL